MQNNFGYQDDFVERKGSNYLDKNQILSYVSEEEIFSLVFGFIPVEYDYVISPFREDSNPGCYFERSIVSGKLKFTDYGDPDFFSEDCFNCVQRYFNLSNFYETLNYIKKRLIDGKNKQPKLSIPLQVKSNITKKQTELTIEARGFIHSDRIYWTKYGISKQNLIDDKVFPVRRYKIHSERKGIFMDIVKTNCYAFTDFESGNKKLYFPYKKAGNRFITNCKASDIGNIKNMKASPQIVIKKSYKDCRVLLNLGANAIWFQNEGMIPEEEILEYLLNEYDDLVIFFDNDETGIKAAIKLKDAFDDILPGKARIVFIPTTYVGIKDPADMRFIMGGIVLRNFLIENNILCD